MTGILVEDLKIRHHTGFDRNQTKEAKIIEVPAIPDAMPEFTTTYETPALPGKPGLFLPQVGQLYDPAFGGCPMVYVAVLPYT